MSNLTLAGAKIKLARDARAGQDSQLSLLPAWRFVSKGDFFISSLWCLLWRHPTLIFHAHGRVLCPLDPVLPIDIRWRYPCPLPCSPRGGWSASSPCSLVDLREVFYFPRTLRRKPRHPSWKPNVLRDPRTAFPKLFATFTHKAS